MVGQALVTRLKLEGWHVSALVRPGSEPGKLDGSVAWEPSKGNLRLDSLQGFDAVVHLGGANIAEKRWTSERKKLIGDSRVQSTRLLSERLAALEKPPEVFICASAIGIYGNRGDEILTEASEPGSGFLAEVGKAWEAATIPAQQAGVRVVCARLGIVLAKEGGALGKMLTPFKLGLGGPLGNGNQYWSWITLQDVVNALLFCLDQVEIEGPVNLVSPQPVTNKTYTAVLAKVLSRPAFLPVPKLAARLALGEMAQPLLFDSTRVHPTVLLQKGFVFQHPELASGIRASL